MKGQELKANSKNAAQLLKETATQWSDDNASRLGAALAYYTVFSLAPLLVIAIGIASLLFGEAAAEGQIVDTLRGMIGESGARMVQTMIRNVSYEGQGIWATVVGAGVLLFGASTVFNELQGALNSIWGVAPSKAAGVKGFILKRLLSIGMVLSIGFLLLVSLILSTALSLVGEFFSGNLPGGVVLWKIINNLISIGVITLIFAALYKVLPDAIIEWKDVWIGAFATAVFFTLGKYLIGLYLAHSSTASTFGAAGSLIVLLLWVYYSAQIMFFGAEFTQVYAQRHGRDIRPEYGAEKIVDGSR